MMFRSRVSWFGFLFVIAVVEGVHSHTSPTLRLHKNNFSRLSNHNDESNYYVKTGTDGAIEALADLFSSKLSMSHHSEAHYVGDDVYVYGHHRELQQASASPTCTPTIKSTKMPSAKSTKMPSFKSTKMPSIKSTKMPSAKSTKMPSVKSTKMPSAKSTKMPSAKSTKMPSVKSTKMPSAKSTKMPSFKSTKMPSFKSTKMPTAKSAKCASAKSTVSAQVFVAEARPRSATNPASDELLNEEGSIALCLAVVGIAVGAALIAVLKIRRVRHEREQS